MTNAPTAQRSISFLRIPFAVWLVAVVGGVIGVLLAEPGSLWGKTVPSAATFFVGALIVGLAGWAVARRVPR